MFNFKVLQLVEATVSNCLGKIIPSSFASGMNEDCHMSVPVLDRLIRLIS